MGFGFSFSSTASSVLIFELFCSLVFLMGSFLLAPSHNNICFDVEFGLAFQVDEEVFKYIESTSIDKVLHPHLSAQK
jgi:hypothetical protein